MKDRYEERMPEGDTLYNIAKMLRPALVGKTVRSLELARLAGDTRVIVGRQVSSVEAHGKNLLITFDNGLVLHTHLKMPGSWHLYRPGQSWTRSPGQARVVLEVEGFQAVCFAAPVVRVLKQEQLKRDVQLSMLGPDLLGETFDEGLAIEGLRAINEWPLGMAFMHQGAVAGIGNVWKSEVLFLEQVNPFNAVSTVTDDALAGVLRRCRALMRKNVGWGDEAPGAARRTTRFDGVSEGTRVWVYRRRGLPCFRCGTTIRMKRQGEAQRSTYFCPTCQGVPPEQVRALFPAATS